MRKILAKNGEKVDFYLIFLMPVIVAALLVFAASIGNEMQRPDSGLIKGTSFSEETIRLLVLSDELPQEYRAKKSGEKIRTRI
ncbi:MAG: hypothetical protein IMF07_06830 [Proteobacteria bacterium]|nr:hypothetical protein [Pseudomonadota bacterium]